MTGMVTPPDPIADAAAYQQMLLAALGGDDPAEVQSRGPADARALKAVRG